MPRFKTLSISFLISLCCLLSISFGAKAAGTVVKVQKNNGNYQLIKDGKPFYIKGAGGETKLEKLKQYGGNSIRTWGTSDQTDALMEKAAELDIMVTFGIWLGQERQGFDYSNKDAVAAQLESCRQTVRKYKDHPALLIWGIGNEMDLDYSNFEVWYALEEICKVIHEEDPNHPIMSVTAGLDVAEIKLIQKNTPSLDILGINTYGNISYLPSAMKMYGWDKPYIIAEWGPYGWWEVGKTEWGAAIEESSSEKAKTYAASLDAITSNKSQCMGSYVFLWGQKQETTSTWFSMFIETGEETEVMDVMIEGWSGKKPQNQAPSIADFQLNGKNKWGNIKVKAATTLNASVNVVDPDNDEIKYVWQLIPESTDKRTGGDAERAPKPVRGIFGKATFKQNKVDFVVTETGEYRLFFFGFDGNGNVATGNIPFKVE